MQDEAQVRVGTPTRSVGAEVARLSVLAAPVVLANLGSMLLGIVDVIMVGALGEQALASVSLGNTWAFALQLLLIGAAAGMDPLFAQAFGSGDAPRAGRALVRGAVLLGILCVPVMLGHGVAGPALTLAQAPPEVIPDAHVYTLVRTLAVVPFAALMLLRQLLQAAGRMWPGFVAILVGNAANVVVNGMLLFGWFGATPVGPVGAAWATVVSTVGMAVVAGVLTLPLLPRLQPRLADLKDLRAFGRMARTCLPVGFQVGLEGWGFSLSTLAVGWFGATAIAAHTVALTLASLAFMVPMGLSSSAAARVGNLIGGGHRWQRAGWTAVAMGGGAMLVWALAFVIAPTRLSALIVHEPEAIALAAALLPIAAGFALFDGTQVVAFGVLRGAGDTTVPAVANIVGYYIVGLPLGITLALVGGLGARGIWLGLATALFCVAALLLVRLRVLGRRGVTVLRE